MATYQPGPTPLTLTLFFKEEPAPIDSERALEVLSKHLGEMTMVDEDDDRMLLACMDYKLLLNDNPAVAFVSLKTAQANESFTPGSQGRLSPAVQEAREQLLADSHYLVQAEDMLAHLLPAQQRTELDTAFLHALLELYPQALGLHSSLSDKIFSRDQLQYEEEDAISNYLRLHTQVRIYKASDDTPDWLVDTLGMESLQIPDLQYEFHTLDPQDVAQHATSVQLALVRNPGFFNQVDTVIGLKDGQISEEVVWTRNVEMSQAEPSRFVFDIHTGEFAAGARQ